VAGLIARVWRAWRDEKDAPMVPARVAGGRYFLPTTDRELRQGEIISDLSHYVVTPNLEVQGQFRISAIPVPYAVVATPDCDLLQSFRALRDGKKERINGVFLFEAEEANVFKKTAMIGSKEWRQYSKNVVEGYHLLEGFDPASDTLNQQIPNLVVDFKRYFMLTTTEIYRQCQNSQPLKAARRCCLNDLWREDFQQRAMSFMQRVGTPALDDAG
jgi:hypothetical protein